MAVPGLTGQIAFVPSLGDTEPWRFLTSGFAHGGLLHIAFNMYALWIMGQYLEPLLGRARFVALYLLSALGGSVGYLLLARPRRRGSDRDRARAAPGGPAVGASGAVFGLFGAFLVLQRRLGRSAAGMYVIIGINAVLGFVVPGIAWQAHLGGLLTGRRGAAAIGYLGRSRGPLEPRDRRVHWAGLAGDQRRARRAARSRSTPTLAEPLVHRLVPLWITRCHSSPVWTTPVDNSGVRRRHPDIVRITHLDGPGSGPTGSVIRQQSRWVSASGSS